MKAQGLPINFIVIAALAVLVLVGILLFFISGFRTESIDRQKAINECESRCLLEVQWASSGGTFPHSNSKYCSYSADVKGLGKNIKCTDLVKCHINVLDCDITCSGTTANCS